MDKTTKQKINKEIEDLNKAINWLDLTENTTQQHDIHSSQVHVGRFPR